LLVGSYSQLGRYEDAWRTCQEGRRHYPEDAELLFREGMLHHHYGRLQEAAQAYRRALEDRDEPHFSSMDGHIVGFKGRHNLALVYEDMGESARAEELWRQVIAEAPGFRPGWRALGESLLRQGKLDVADQYAEKLMTDSGLPDYLRLEGLILRGRILTRQGDLVRAKQVLHEAVDRWPDELEGWHSLSQFLFEHGEPAEAEQALRRLLQLAPEDAAAHHNLANVRSMLGKHAEAINGYRESLRLRPDSAMTHAHLGHALWHSGRVADAVSAWRQAILLDPGNPVAREGLRQVGGDTMNVLQEGP